MAAYAALVSLMNTITMERIGHYPGHQISFDVELIEALQERVNFLVEFLEGGWKGAQRLEDRITNAAHAAEDAIEFYVVDQYHAGYRNPGEKGSAHTFEDLGKIIQDMDSIKNDAIEIKVKSGFKDVHGGSSRSITSSKKKLKKRANKGLPSTPQSKKSKMVGFEEEKAKVMDELRGENFDRTIISIAGMGGSGKTTLARNIFEDELIVQHFDVHIWITVSLEYDVQEILKGILSILKNQGNDENLGEQVYKSLFGRRYLVVLDDIWSINVWDEINTFFPNDGNRSRIMVTTRHSNFGRELSTSSLEMKHLDKDNSWKLFQEKAFGQNSCPLVLEGVGKQIAYNCKGLPLAIVVVGGFLAKFNKRIEYWNHVANLSRCATIYLDDNHGSKLLSLSYNYLPVHLKPCFLYMGVFPEDHEIRVSNLINLWIAEGFLKPVSGKTLEEIAEEYLQDLIERNLIMVDNWGSNGKIKSCTIHDLLRELCLREAQKDKFLCVITSHSVGASLSLNCQRRIVMRRDIFWKENYSETIEFLLSKSHARSLIVNIYDYEDLSRLLGSSIFKLLRVFFVIDPVSRRNENRKCISKLLFNHVSLRYVAYTADREFNEILASSIDLPRNLQMLVVRHCLDPISATREIWNLPQLRHLEFEKIFLPEPQFSEQELHHYVVLQNVSTLKGLENFRFDDELSKKIPNIKKMEVCYRKYKWWSHYSVQNLGQFQKLESFNCSFIDFAPNRNAFLRNLSFPRSLKKLSLSGCRLLWEDMSVMGSLPHLEVLKLKFKSIIGSEWNPVEGEFSRLKFLYMDWAVDLINWNADRAHFPCLEQLVLCWFTKLKEIPLVIGDIATLRLIQLRFCSDSAVISAKNIQDDQRNFGNDGPLVKVFDHKKSKLLSVLESKNFLVEIE